MKYLLIAVGVLIVLAIVGKQTGVISSGKEILVAVDKASNATITETVAASGKIQPETEVKISADVSGEIVELAVIEGQKVKQGDLLVRIDPEIYISTVDRLSASVNNSKANLANAKARLSQSQAQFIKTELDYKRNEKLYKEKVISDSEFETIKSSYAVAKAETEASKQTVLASGYGVESAVAALTESKENLKKTSIYAPIDGTVSKLNVEKGERVVATSQFSGTELMRIANLGEMEVNVDVSENDIIRVKLNDTCMVEVEAYPNRKFTGLVTEIGSSANVAGVSADQVTNFSVKIRILRTSYEDLIPADNPAKSPFRPGMSATVDIQTKRVFNVLSIPIQCVTTRDTLAEKNKKIVDPGLKEEDEAKSSSDSEISEFVFTIKEGKAVLTPVKTGIQDNMLIEIISGLKVGDEVISGPYSAISRTLKKDDVVKVVAKEDLFKDKKN